MEGKLVTWVSEGSSTDPDPNSDNEVDYSAFMMLL
jgi:hypothetical protein